MKTLSKITIAAWAAMAGLASMAAATEPTASKPGKVEMPKPPAEITDLLRVTEGTWRCRGKAWMPDGSEHEMSGLFRSTSHFGGFWVKETWDGKMSGFPFKFEAFSTYDAKMKKWRRVSVNSLGGQSVGTSDGLTTDMKMDFTQDVIGMLGPILLKEHMDASDAKAGLRLWTERSMDKGKTWEKDYELVCRK